MTLGTGAGRPINSPRALSKFDRFTSSGTYVKPSWARTIIVECIGGGGGGAGGEGAAAASIRSPGGGGGGGARVRHVFAASDVGATETVTIGAGDGGGAGGSSGNGTNSGAGGDTTFGSLLTAFGGGGTLNSTAGNRLGGGGGGSCFIATAAYGTPLADDIYVRRAVRDSYLLNNAIGVAFVDAYYRLSPPVADAVANNAVMKAAVRTVLTPVVIIGSFVLAMPGLSVVLLLAGVALVAARMRRRTTRV